LYLFIALLVLFTSGATALFVTRYANLKNYEDELDYVDSVDLETEGAILEADLVSVGALSAGDD